MNAPTPGHLRLLRLINVSVQLREPTHTQNHTLVLNGVCVGIVRNKTIATFKDNGWIQKAAEGWWVLTREGRAVAESGVFIRAFVAAPEAS